MGLSRLTFQGPFYQLAPAHPRAVEIALPFLDGLDRRHVPAGRGLLQVLLLRRIAPLLALGGCLLLGAAALVSLFVWHVRDPCKPGSGDFDYDPPMTRPCRIACAGSALAALALLLGPQPLRAQAAVPIKAALPPAGTPAWNKGIQPLTPESYYHAIECGKSGEAQSPCVFYDAGLCKNDDYTLALYSPYKQVAYEVWTATSRKREAPTPNYRAAQQTRVVLGVTPIRAAKNPLVSVAIKRGGKTIAPAVSTPDGGGGTFIFDFAAWAPTAGITIELTGKVRPIACVLSPAVLARLR